MGCFTNIPQAGILRMVNVYKATRSSHEHQPGIHLAHKDADSNKSIDFCFSFLFLNLHS